MHLSPELKALRWALAAASLSLGSTWLVASSIQAMASITSPEPSPELSSEIVISPALVSQGREFYEMSCSQCHADDASGDEGPTLHNLSISNARIAATVKKGIKGEMPSFVKKYDDRQVAALISYLRSLR